MVTEIENILADRKMTRCFDGLFSQLGSKHHPSKRANNIKHDVDQLLQQAERKEESKKSFVSGNEIVDMIMNAMRDLGVRKNGMYGLSDDENRTLIRQIVSNRADDMVQGYDQSFDSRNRTLEKIMKALRSPLDRMIGIYGPDGMGKTTLAREVARRAKAEKLFDKVGMITVSRNSDTKAIQSQIAEEMELKLEDENVIGRAQILVDSLFRQKKSLVILDDLWDVNLKEFGDNCYQHDFDFKILLISRSRLLLDKYVPWSMFPLGALEEKEGKTLLRKVARIDELLDSASESLVDKFAIKTCALSPHLILSIGSYLRGKSYCQWKIAFEMLQDIKFTEFALQDMQYFPIELSIKHLERDLVLRDAFLLWAQMGHHLSLIDFVKYYNSLINNYYFGIISGGCERVIPYSISQLKESNLVLDNHSSDRITMRDEVRDFALSISSKQHNFFTMQNGKLEKWPNKNELKSCTAIILHSSVIINELPEGIHCPQLKVFHLDSMDPFLKIPDNFFHGMRQLQILELICIQLPILPSSIGCLKALRMLSLERCMLSGNLSIIGELKEYST